MLRYYFVEQSLYQYLHLFIEFIYIFFLVVVKIIGYLAFNQYHIPNTLHFPCCTWYQRIKKLQQLEYHNQYRVNAKYSSLNSDLEFI